MQSIREGGDEGIPVMMGDDEVTKKSFREFADVVIRSIAMRNANMQSEAIAEKV